MKTKNKKQSIAPIFVLLVLAWMILTNNNKTAVILAENAKAYTEYTFNLEPPENASKWQIEYDIDRLARAVARHETGNCTLGYGAEYNNCFGIKNGNTAPCKKIGRNRMCIYDTPGESYEAFKKIWSTWYDGMPTLKTATIWSGNDNARAWKNNVTNFYYNN